MPASIMCFPSTVLIYEQKETFSTWQLQKDQQDAEEAAHNQRLKEIGRLADSRPPNGAMVSSTERRKYGVQSPGLKPDRGYLGHQAAKMMQRAKSIQARQQKRLKKNLVF